MKKMKKANVAMRSRTVAPWTYVTMLLGTCAILLLFVGTPAGGEEGEQTEACMTNFDCASGEFCNKPAGDCAGEGVCTPVPIPGELACLDVWDPVCGCNGQTYSNDCYAFLAGVNVAGPGECNGNGNGPGVPPLFCLNDGQCGDGQFCNKPDGACDGFGQCEDVPGDDQACALILDPVCGCDGNTYDNDCFAWLAGVNVAFSGECEDGPAPTCIDDSECPEGFACKTPFGECDAEGTCVEVPEPGTLFCTMIYDPVCGCDGVTYGNPCLAFLVGASIASMGECPQTPDTPCTSDADCNAGHYCSTPMGECGGEGVCVEETPPGKFACPQVFDPVCGCDGKTYGNGCEAFLANANLAYAGPCCKGDLTLNMQVNVFDLLALLEDWGTCPGCISDLTGDGQVNVFDLLELLENWGACPDPPDGPVKF
ncbi:MAG: hypothetical protein EA377_01740 [Phycisphaerales bacterium]|nr:MAG: hypothetical protein EA377_01740 [Phycisphaerales bacterium]